MKKAMVLTLALALLVLSGCAQEEEEVPQTLPRVILTEAPTVPTEAPTLPPETEAPAETVTEAVTEPETEPEDAQPAVSIPTEPTEPPIPKEEFGVRGAVVGSAKVNVRKGPSVYCPVVKKVSLDDTVTVHEVGKFENTSWARVDEGWMALGYIELVDELPETWETAGTPGMITGSEVVNVRKEPSASSDKVGRLNRRDVVHVYEVKEMEKGTWGRTETGWISMNYIDLADPVELKNKPASDPDTQTTP